MAVGVAAAAVAATAGAAAGVRQLLRARRRGNACGNGSPPRPRSRMCLHRYGTASIGVLHLLQPSWMPSRGSSDHFGARAWSAPAVLHMQYRCGDGCMALTRWVRRAPDGLERPLPLSLAAAALAAGHVSSVEACNMVWGTEASAHGSAGVHKQGGGLSKDTDCNFVLRATRSAARCEICACSSRHPVHYHQLHMLVQGLVC